MKYTTSTMKGQFIAVAFLAILSCFGALGAIGGYDYCGKPCTDGGGMVCAYNQQCFTYFLNLCEMKKRNCDYNDRFQKLQQSSCLFGSPKCRGI